MHDKVENMGTAKPVKTDWITPTVFAVFLNSAVAFFSYHQWPEGALFTIISTVTVLLLVHFNHIKGKEIPIYLFAISLATILQASMFGAHVIGSDMHGEYYASRIIAADGDWEIARHYGTQSSTSVVVSAFIPVLSNALHIDIIWFYKVILPIGFALVPVVLYLIYKKFLSDKLAFYSALFFLIVPITSLEIVQIGKSMAAEFFMALALFTIVVSADWKWYEQLQAVVIFSITAMLCHYTVGIALLAFLVGIGIIRFIPKLKILANKATSAFMIPVVVVVLAGTGGLYYSIADQGVIMKVMSRVVPVYSNIILQQASDTATSIYVLDPTDTKTLEDSEGGYFDKHEVLMKTAIGIDFPQASTAGKAFRITQYLTQLLICVGGMALFWLYKRYQFTAEFVAGIWSSYILMAMCVFVPQFSNIINLTRFYHFALFFLAPMFVVGGLVVLRKEWLLVTVIIIYYAFTSGAVFEITQSNSIDKVDTPYSVGLSAERTGVVGNYSPDDVKAVEWLEINAKPGYMVVGDYNGWHLVSAYLGMDRLREDMAMYNPTFDSLPDKPTYIFTTTWNNTHGQYIDSLKDIWGGAGLRGSYPMPEFGYPVVFESGKAIIYEK